MCAEQHNHYRQAGDGTLVGNKNCAASTPLLYGQWSTGCREELMLAACRAVVLQKVTVAAEPKQSPPPSVDIIGRQAGLVAWFLTLIGFANTIRMTVSRTGLTLQISSLQQGQLSYWVPLSSVSVVTTGYVKPFFLLILTGMCVLAALFTAGISLFFAAVFILVYFLQKKLVIQISANSGDRYFIAVKRSVIEGVSLDEGQALEIVAIIRDLVIESRQNGGAEISPGDEGEIYDPIAVTPRK
jgi:hypothetical protein